MHAPKPPLDRAAAEDWIRGHLEPVGVIELVHERPWPTVLRVPGAGDHLAHGVPDLRVATLPVRYDDLLRHELPLERDEIGRLRAFRARFAELCAELTTHGVPETIQHDDLHMGNVYAQGERLRVLD